MYLDEYLYNLLVTFITGDVSMVIFFFVFKIIFPEGEKIPENENWRTVKTEIYKMNF